MSKHPAVRVLGGMVGIRHTKPATTVRNEWNANIPSGDKTMFIPNPGQYTLFLSSVYGGKKI